MVNRHGKRPGPRRHWVAGRAPRFGAIGRSFLAPGVGLPASDRHRPELLPLRTFFGTFEGKSKHKTSGSVRVVKTDSGYAVDPGASASGFDPGTTGVRAASADSSDPGVDITPLLRERLHDTLEKVAWEAFSELSEQVVRQVLERVETIAWEVIPQMTETMIREEIQRMKGEDDS